MFPALSKIWGQWFFGFLIQKEKISQGLLLLTLPYVAACPTFLEEIRDGFVMFQGGDWFLVVHES